MPTHGSIALNGQSLTWSDAGVYSRNGQGALITLGKWSSHDDVRGNKKAIRTCFAILSKARKMKSSQSGQENSFLEDIGK